MGIRPETAPSPKCKGKARERPRERQREKGTAEDSKERVIRAESSAMLGTITRQGRVRARVIPDGRAKEDREEKEKGLVWLSAGRRTHGAPEE